MGQYVGLDVSHSSLFDKPIDPLDGWYVTWIGDSDLGPRGRHTPPASRDIHGCRVVGMIGKRPCSLCRVAKIKGLYCQLLAGPWCKLDPAKEHLFDARIIYWPLSNDLRSDMLRSPTLRGQRQEQSKNKREGNDNRKTPELGHG